MTNKYYQKPKKESEKKHEKDTKNFFGRKRQKARKGLRKMSKVN